MPFHALLLGPSTLSRTTQHPIYDNTDNINGSQPHADFFLMSCPKVVSNVSHGSCKQLSQVSTAADAIPEDEYPPGELDESNEMLLARLRRVQYSLQSLFSEIHSQIARLQKAQLSKRSVIWLKTGIL
jgi:hypothetical protein